MGLSFSSTYDQLVKAIEENDMNGLKTLLNSLNKDQIRDYCADSCVEDELNRSLLHHAAWKEDNTILQVLMPYCEGESLEIYDAYGMTPLGASVNRGNYSAIKTLLEHSSQVNCDQQGGYYLVRNALYNNRPDIVDLLIQYNCVTKNATIDAEVGSLLHVACDIGNEVMVKTLVEKAKLDVNVEDKWKIKPVHVASAKNHVSVLKYLLEKEADVNCEDIFGNTPLGWAIFSKSATCEAHLKSSNAKYKEFIVPPPVEETSGEEVVVNETAVEPLEIIDPDTVKEKKRAPPIPNKIGAANPTFELNEDKTAVSTV